MRAGSELNDVHVRGVAQEDAGRSSLSIQLRKNDEVIDGRPRRVCFTIASENDRLARKGAHVNVLHRPAAIEVFGRVGDASAVRRPGDLGLFEHGVGHAYGAGVLLRSHRVVDLNIAVPVAQESDALAVGAPNGFIVVGIVSEDERVGAVRVDDGDVSSTRKPRRIGDVIGLRKGCACGQRHPQEEDGHEQGDRNANEVIPHERNHV